MGVMCWDVASAGFRKPASCLVWSHPTHAEQLDVPYSYPYVLILVCASRYLEARLAMAGWGFARNEQQLLYRTQIGFTRDRQNGVCLP